VRLLEAVREFAPKARYYQASTSELFGDCPPPQNELSPMIPASPYAAAKLYAHNMTRIYRKAYGLFACCGILMNHESTRRGPNFVTRKITLAIARISYHQQGILELGNMQARRDWGHARDYVRAMWMMLQRERPDDFVIGTGETHTVQEFVEATFNAAGLDWKKYVVVNPKFYRPLDVNYLQADITKARTVLGWSPVITFEDLVHIMVRHDLDMLSPNKMQEMEVQS
jgi:GDPmannose 4,6-dehydratase